MPSIQSQKRSKAHKRNAPNTPSSGSERPGSANKPSSDQYYQQNQEQQPQQQQQQSTSGGPIDPAAKQAYNYGVLSLHDPDLAQVFATSSICNVYRYNLELSEWEKLECQGTLFVYSRRQDRSNASNLTAGSDNKRRTKKQGNTNTSGGNRSVESDGNSSDTLSLAQQQDQSNDQDQSQQNKKQDAYPYGLMVLNRLSLENFSLGITPLSVSTKHNYPEMDVKLDDPFIMIEAADGEMYGLWLFHEEDRPLVQGMIKWCLDAQI